ncbi:MAG: hypothetical protein QOJ42_1025, partial [Acidobacteriaceae bacterium]|nr:hypothetical protein [Acidobacteriaceae bacterium]
MAPFLFLVAHRSQGPEGSRQIMWSRTRWLCCSSHRSVMNHAGTRMTSTKPTQTIFTTISRRAGRAVFVLIPQRRQTSLERAIGVACVPVNAAQIHVIVFFALLIEVLFLIVVVRIAVTLLRRRIGRPLPFVTADVQ